jgi:sugar phosphate isomerase/epimerase
MEVLFFCPIWGLVPDYTKKIDADINKVFSKVKQAGYHGIEMTIPSDQGQVKEVLRLLQKYELEIIAHEWANDGDTVAELIGSFEQHILRAALVNPLFINAHTGKDYFSFAANCKLIAKAFALEKQIGIKINHEIHRGRFSFHSYTMLNYLKAYPSLTLTADFSHWCNVSESFLTNQQETVAQTITHCRHIHARVGHTQSCQVPDPADPMWEKALLAHLNWWDKIYEHNMKIGKKSLTITPEFGPAPYMTTIPYTNEPIANQWEINLWMKDLLQKRYVDQFNEAHYL